MSHSFMRRNSMYGVENPIPHSLIIPPSFTSHKEITTLQVPSSALVGVPVCLFATQKNSIVTLTRTTLLLLNSSYLTTTVGYLISVLCYHTILILNLT
jgi:hypothetical protein